MMAWCQEQMRGGSRGKGSRKVSFGLRPATQRSHPCQCLRAEHAGGRKASTRACRRELAMYFSVQGACELSQQSSLNTGYVLEVWTSGAWAGLQTQTWTSPSVCRKHESDDPEDCGGHGEPCSVNSWHVSRGS